jgi:hypothetical protein
MSKSITLESHITLWSKLFFALLAALAFAFFYAFIECFFIQQVLTATYLHIWTMCFSATSMLFIAIIAIWFSRQIEANGGEQ